MTKQILWGLYLVLSIAVMSISPLIGGYLFLVMVGIDTTHLTYSTLYDYYQAYHSNHQITNYVMDGVNTTILVMLSPFYFGILIWMFTRNIEALHGDARWANDKELKKSGLVDTKPGKYPEILLGKIAEGKYEGEYIRFRGQQFVGLSAPTRSGKGVGIVIPNLLNYPDSIVNSDIKLENFRKTAGFRQSCGQQVFLFSPDGYAVTELDREKGVLRSHQWNPLTYIRRQEIFRIGDILAISAIFYPLTGDKNDVWNELAGKLFKGLVLYMLDNEKYGCEVTFPKMLSLTAPEGGLDAWMKDQIEAELCSQDCKEEFYAFMAAPNETKGSIVSNLVSPLAIFSDKVCAAAVSGDSFDLREIRRTRMSIYVGVQPTNTKKFAKLLNLFWSQLITENTRIQPEDDPTLESQCLLMLDEFTSLGRVDIIQESIGYTASYNMRYLLIYQSDAQLEHKKLYDKEGTQVLKDNLAVELIYPPKKVTQHTKNLSETFGYKTVKKTSRSRSHSMGKNRSTTDADREEKRALMLPQEIVELGFEKYMGVGLKEIVIMENMRPFKANKIIYFDEPVFAERVKYSQANLPEIPLLVFSGLPETPVVPVVPTEPEYNQEETEMEPNNEDEYEDEDDDYGLGDDGDPF